VKISQVIVIAVLGLVSGLPATGQQQGAAVPEVNAEELQAGSAPQDVIESAVAAVTKLGEEVVKGRFDVAVERMNPEWKKRAATRAGGMEELEKQLAGVARQMVQRGISMISFKPQGEPRSFEVWTGKKVEGKWMVLVPTVTKFRITRENERPVFVESVGFQVAISDKDAIDWTFIDGSGVTVNELRRLFITLPANLELPPLEQREVQ
jgi:hypothetical protein